MRRKSQKSRTLPRDPHISTRLYLRRLEAAGVDAVEKLTVSHWETIYRLEAGKAGALELRQVRR